jgi:hypothetical protein
MIFSCMISNVRSGHAPNKKVTQVVTIEMIFLTSTSTTFPWPLARKSFCGNIHFKIFELTNSSVYEKCFNKSISIYLILQFTSLADILFADR